MSKRKAFVFLVVTLLFYLLPFAPGCAAQGLILPPVQSSGAGGDVISSDALQEWLTVLRPPLAQFQTACFHFAKATAIYIAGIALLLKALFHMGSQRNWEDSFVEWLIPVLFTAYLLNQTTYADMSIDWLWRGVAIELAGSSESLQRTSTAMQLAMAASVKGGGSELVDTFLAANMPLMPLSLVKVTQLFLAVMYPTLVALLASSVAVVAFLQAIGPIFVALIPLEFTRDYFRRWLGLYLGSLFSCVAIIVLVGAWIGHGGLLSGNTLEDLLDLESISRAADMSFTAAIHCCVMMIGIFISVPRVVSACMRLFA